MADTKKSMIKVLGEYFGHRPPNEDAQLTPEELKKLPYERQVASGGLKGFFLEFKRLTDEDALELAQMAAVELGLSQEDISFSLAS